MFFYLVNTTFTRTLATQYHLDTGTIGLCYLPLAFGAMVGNQLGGRLSDHIYNKRVAAAKANGDNQAYPEMRISGLIIILSVALACCGYVAYGWCTQKNVHYAFALVSIFFCKYARSMIPLLWTVDLPHLSSLVSGHWADDSYCYNEHIYGGFIQGKKCCCHG
jgi:MFS family permease